MPGVEFFQTVMGHRFYEGTLPGLVRAVENLTLALTRHADALNAQRATEAQDVSRPAPDSTS